MYIGRKPEVGNYRKADSISVVNGQATYNLTVNSEAVNPNANQVICSLNGVIQSSNDSFSIANNQITFASNLQTGDVIDFILILGDTLDVGTPSDNTVSTDKLVNSSVTSGKLSSTAVDNTNTNSTLITAQTEKTSLVDADKFLISDSAASGALKYVQKSNLPSGGLVHLGSNTISSTVTSSALSHFTTDYEVYLVNGYLSAVTSGADMYIRFRTSSGDNTNNSYQTSITANLQSNGSVATAEDFGGWGLTYIPWVNGVVDSNIGVIRFTFFVYNPMSTNHNTGLTGNAAYYRTNNSWVSANISAYSGDGASTQHTGITFLTSSGGYDLGKINVYGIKNS